MTKLKTAVIGCGSIFPQHADALMDCPDADLYAVCDIDESRAKAAAGKYGCRSFTDYTEVLKDNKIDAIHLCTPHYLHAPFAIGAMNAGKHVLTEKPMAITVGDAEKMIETSGKTGKSLGVCFQNRYNRTCGRIKEIVDTGRAGRVLGAKALVLWHRGEEYYSAAEWRGTWEMEGGGVLINQAIHTLDLLQWFMGDIDRLKASVDTRLLKGIIEVEDTAEATILFGNGAAALFYATNCYVSNSPIEIELICEKAKIQYNGELNVFYDDGTKEHVTDVDRTTGGKAYWGCGHKEYISDFYEKITKGQSVWVDGRQGINSVKIIEAMYKSDKTGEYVKVT